MNYNELSITNNNLEEEKTNLMKIFDCIDKQISFIYDTGAGSGKTYALKEGLVHTIKKNGRFYEKHNQNILCITYTNVAANEIKNRLGTTKIVQVSTIHDRIWDIIKKFKKELLNIHKMNLENELQRNIDIIVTSKEAKWYRDTVLNKEEFLTKTINNIKDYQCNYNKNANEFKINFIGKHFQELTISNVAHFKKTVNAILSKYRIENAIKQIEEKGDVIKIEYTPKINRNQLTKFKISHDTLLDYAEKLIELYPSLQNLLCDKYPIIFIDEYQDTSEKIIHFIDLIREGAAKYNKKICIGFFGDCKQNIYDEGIGSNIYNYKSKYEIVTNNFNRRSSHEIVCVANNIRNDSLRQKTIYNNFHADNCAFYNDTLDETNINNIKQNWNISKDNKLYCFLLKNEFVAEKNDFLQVYQAFKSCYPGIKYEQLNSELFSDDDSKLGEIQLLFKQVMKFKNKINDDKSLIRNFIDFKCNKYSVNNIEDIISKCKKVCGEKIGEYVLSLCQELKDNSNIIQHILGEDILSNDDFKSKISFVLFQDIEEPSIDSFLDLPINELDNWYKYITNDFVNKEIVYQTIHSTKGLQYDNVVIELDDDFARDKTYFKRFFQNYHLATDKIDDNKFLKAQNLLYVGVTRAIKNLAVYYNFDEKEIDVKRNIEQIFSINSK